MRLADIPAFDEIRKQLAQAKGLGCSYCDIYHPAMQCLQPRNASRKAALPSYSDGAYEVADANAIGYEELQGSNWRQKVKSGEWGYDSNTGRIKR